ncbi:BldC family transcriptional regulator [Rhodococcus qingshengii]|uniref:BldC family transcriptional regulator n=1 Tax=Rhodococcus qingshengii TaxID=334542 RepID=A0AAW6LUV7_RHOSG|nr:BldC family transcriptional regulator [Rhodococcus qingshengii]MDE8649678.1 BldC family transcriptional regulator [Rhodococcus qingshengii]
MEQILTSGQVAVLFGVDPGTVVRWTQAGKISATRTVGGHRRYRSSEVLVLLQTLKNSGPAADTETRLDATKDRAAIQQ